MGRKLQDTFDFSKNFASRKPKIQTPGNYPKESIQQVWISTEQKETC
jgi:hypothetical protein